MTANTYYILLVIINGLLLFLGAHLTLGAVSKDIRKTPYLRARRLAGHSMMMCPMAGYIYYFCNMQSLPAYYGTALNLTAYYLTCVFISMSFVKMISYKSTKFKVFNNIVLYYSIIFAALSWLPIAFDMIEIMRIAHTIAIVMLGACEVYLLMFIYRIYKKLAKRIDDYYSDDVERHILWIKRSIYLFVGLGLTSCLSAFPDIFSPWVYALYLIYQAAIYVYIYESVVTFELTTLSLSNAREEDDVEIIPAIETAHVTLNSETKQHIANGLEKWIERKGYLIQGITVKSVASDIYTNRSYLSSYINTTFEISFKSWITSLRIEEAKRLLVDPLSGCSIAGVAMEVGFSSQSSFVHTFKKVEGQTPARWREANKIILTSK